MSAQTPPESLNDSEKDSELAGGEVKPTNGMIAESSSSTTKDKSVLLAFLSTASKPNDKLPPFWRLPNDSLWVRPEGNNIIENLDAVSIVRDSLKGSGTAQIDDFLAERYGIWRDYVKHEDSLVNNRMTWFVGFHSFLIAAFGLTLTGYLGIVFGSDAPSGVQYLALTSLVMLFLIGVTVVGMATAHATYTSVKSAYSAIEYLENDWAMVVASIRGTSMTKPRSSPNQEGRSEVDIVYPLLPGLIGGGAASNVLRGFMVASRLPSLTHWLWVWSCAIPLIMLLAPMSKDRSSAYVVLCDFVGPVVSRLAGSPQS